jgi:hypothetical protein
MEAALFGAEDPPGAPVEDAAELQRFCGRWLCVKPVALREAVALDSELCGGLHVGETIDVTEVCEADSGQLRLRCPTGWTSALSRDGQTLMTSLSDSCRVGATFKDRRCTLEITTYGLCLYHDDGDPSQSGEAHLAPPDHEWRYPSLGGWTNDGSRLLVKKRDETMLTLQLETASEAEEISNVMVAHATAKARRKVARRKDNDKARRITELEEHLAALDQRLEEESDGLATVPHLPAVVLLPRGPDREHQCCPLPDLGQLTRNDGWLLHYCLGAITLVYFLCMLLYIGSQLLGYDALNAPKPCMYEGETSCTPQD